ncbi:Integrase core domain [Popillia japonica]|uniref:Integrase core domain n=1 Tax=Popillia japonica TaxID=7064 RepID=A0AAW1JE56_POPJA
MASSILAPLYELGKKDQSFSWTEVCDEAFLRSKTLLQQSPMLVHYNPKYGTDENASEKSVLVATNRPGLGKRSKIIPCVSAASATEPRARLHQVDFFQKYDKYFLIIVDSASRWIDVKIVPSTNSDSTISTLRSVFSSLGIPMELVSDNGPPFNGEKFKRFCAANGIKHTLTPPLHPRSNGTVERQVATVKRSLEKQLSYAPAEFLLKRIPRTKLDLLKPTNYKRTHDTLKEMSSTDKMFVEGEEVLVWNKRNNDKKWITGKIAKQVSPFTYLVNVNGEVRFVHAEDLKVNQPPTWRFPVCPLPKQEKIK